MRPKRIIQEVRGYPCIYIPKQFIEDGFVPKKVVEMYYSSKTKELRMKLASDEE